MISDTVTLLAFEDRVLSRYTADIYCDHSKILSKYNDTERALSE